MKHPLLISSRLSWVLLALTTFFVAFVYGHGGDLHTTFGGFGVDLPMLQSLMARWYRVAPLLLVVVGAALLLIRLEPKRATRCLLVANAMVALALAAVLSTLVMGRDSV